MQKLIDIKYVDAATYILNEDNEFECLHDEGTHVETVEVDTMRNGEHDTYEVRIYVCDTCDAEVDGDPDADRADALADMQIMEALGK
jgi:hypothetical protein